ncbi:MAG TPA: hypothetical protein VLC46_07750 [Thermoanaerobaculia bacterium]|jgi:hypothetical protein|nr:hypothetical protein [Thermoanaerobaculia bacterium]
MKLVGFIGSLIAFAIVDNPPAAGESATTNKPGRTGSSREAARPVAESKEYRATSPRDLPRCRLLATAVLYLIVVFSPFATVCEAAGASQTGSKKQGDPSASSNQSGKFQNQAQNASAVSPGTRKLDTVTVCYANAWRATRQASADLNKSASEGTPVSPATPISFDDIVYAYEHNEQSDLLRNLHDIAISLLVKSDEHEPAAPPCLTAPADVQKALKESRVSFVFVDDITTPPVIVRVLAGGSPTPDPGSQRTINTRSLIHVYILRNAKMEINTQVTAARYTSPVQTNLSQFLGNIGGAVAKQLSVPAPVEFRETQLVDSAERSGGPTVTVLVRKTSVPSELTWATLGISDTANIASLLDYDSASSRIDHDKEFSRLDAASIRTLKEPYVSAFSANGKCNKFIKGPASPTPGGEQADPKATALQAKALQDCQDALDAAHAQNASSKILNADYKYVDPAARMYAMFSLVKNSVGATSDTTQLPLTTTYTYGPLTQWSLGLGGGAMAHYWHRQVKAGTPEGTAVTDDPPSGAFTSVNVYWSHKGYDEDTDKPSDGEIYRWVCGAILTPDPGVFVGRSRAFRAARNVTLNVGYAIMSAPIEGNTKLRSKRGALGAFIVGLGYGFQ